MRHAPQFTLPVVFTAEQIVRLLERLVNGRLLLVKKNTAVHWSPPSRWRSRQAATRQ